MQMSDYLKSTQQQPTVPPVRQRPKFWFSYIKVSIRIIPLLLEGVEIE